MYAHAAREEVLDEGIEDVSGVLKAAGIDVILNKVKVETVEQAIQYKLVTSPTILVTEKT